MKKWSTLIGLVFLSVAAYGAGLSTSGGGASATVDGDKPHVSSSSENVFFTSWGHSTYTLSASPGGGYVFIDSETKVSAGEPNGTNSAKKTITDTNATPESFSLGLYGKMYKPGGSGGSPIDWSASIASKFFYIKSNQNDGSKNIIVPHGTSVIYTAYSDTSTQESTWNVSGFPQKDSDSIRFNKSWWLSLWPWSAPNITDPVPGVYNINATSKDPIGGTDSGEMKVIGVASVSGHGKTSTREESPSGADKWTDAETIYAQPQAVIELTMTLDPNVTPDDTLENSIDWSVSGWFTSITPKDIDKRQATFKPGSSGEYVVTASCGTSKRLIRIKVATPKIHKVTFGGSFITINKDTGGSYSDAAWQDDDLDGNSDLTNANADSSKKYQPVAYRSTTTMSAIAVFKPNCRNSDDTDFISAYDVEAAVKKVRFTPYSFWSSNNWSTPITFNMPGNNSVTAASAFKSSPEVGYDGSFKLAWEVGFGETGTSDSNLSWERSYSEHELYLTYAAAISSYESVFHLSCTKANGGTNVNPIIADIWSGFTDRNVKRKDNTVLTYYNSYLTSVTSVEGLLNGTDGQCGSWADFFRTALAIHGISSDYIRFSPATGHGGGFIVKTWSFDGSGTSGNADFPYQNDLPSSGDYIGTNQYNWGTTAEVTYTSGTPGQNNPKPASLFGNHQIIRQGGVYYDPSLGIKHTAVQSIDDSLSGFLTGAGTAFIFKKNPTGVQISITVH